MTSFILIDCECSITHQKTRIKRETLYKKCGFKTDIDFGMRHTWLVETSNIHSIELWAQCSGTVENVNKFTLPAPLNDKTYYGTLAIVALNEKGVIISMNIEKWKKIYEQLMVDIDTEELQSDDDDDEDDESFSVKEKAFVDEDSCEDADENEYDDDENDEKNAVHQNPIETEFDEDEMLNQLQCGSELEEEAYDYPDT